jgi:hypothetical protein
MWAFLWKQTSICSSFRKLQNSVKTLSRGELQDKRKSASAEYSLLQKGGSMRARTIAYAAVTAGCMVLAGCGSKVSGHTYHDNGGVVTVEFKSGGKALVSAGPVTQNCSYSETGKTISLICEGDTTQFTLEEDGALAGPPDGMLARLTPVKK